MLYTSHLTQNLWRWDTAARLFGSSPGDAMCNGRREQVISSTVVFQPSWVPALAASMHISTSVTHLYWVRNLEGEAQGSVF